jgi:gliding motility-associated-like protein
VSSGSLTGCKGTCFTFSNSSSAFNPFTYNWGDGTALSPTVSSHCYSVAGIYSVTAMATYSSGCSVVSSGVLTVTVLAAPLPGIDIAGGNIQTINLPVTFHNLSSGANSFTWSFNDSSSVFNTLTMNDVIHTYTASGTYCAKLIAVDTILGCKDSTNKCLDIHCISHMHIPNVFSPNGDDVNEVFKFENECIQSLNCVIYDRWGLLVYEWDTVNGGWDGHTFAGIAVSEGIYFFILNYVDSNNKEIKKTGYISLVR